MRRLVIFLFVALFAASAAQARHVDIHQEPAQDSLFSNVQCWADGAPVPKESYASLWNPSQNTVVRGTGSELSYEFTLANISRTEAPLRCRLDFTRPQKVIAFELESARATRITSLNAGGDEYVLTPIQVSSFKKIRSQFPVKFSNFFEFTAVIPCSGGKCQVDFTEVNILPTDLEPFALVTDESGIYTRDMALPGETLQFLGSVGQKVHICDGFRNACAYVQPAVCKKTKFLGIVVDEDCRFYNCYGAGFRDNVQFLSSSDFDSGRCASWFETTGLKIIGALIITVAAIFTGGVALVLLAGLGAAISVYNIDQPLSDQWLTLTVAFVAGAATAAIGSALGGSQYAALGNAITGGEIGTALILIAQIVLSQVAQYYWGKFVTPAIVEQFDSDLGKTFAAALSGVVGGLASSAAVAGLTATIGAGIGAVSTGSLSTSLSTAASIGVSEFTALSAGEIVAKAFLEVLTRVAQTYTAQYVAELCVEQLADTIENPQALATTCGIIASSTVNWLGTAFRAYWMGALVPTREMDVVAKGNADDTAVLSSDGTRSIDGRDVTIDGEGVGNGYAFNEAFDMLDKDTIDAINNGIRTGDFFDSTSGTDLNSEWSQLTASQQNFIRNSQLLALTPIERRILSDARSQGTLDGVLNQVNLYNVRLGAEQLVQSLQNNIRQNQDFGKAQERLQIALEQALKSGSACSCYGQLLPTQQYLLDPKPCTGGSYGPARYIGAEEGAITAGDDYIATEVGQLGLGWCDPFLNSFDDKTVKAFSDGKFSVVVQSGTSVIEEDHGTTGQNGAALAVFSAPSRPGVYVYNLSVAANATSPIINKIIETNVALGNVFSRPLILPGLIDQVGDLIEILEEAAHLSELRNRMIEIQSLLNDTANMPITENPPQITDTRQKAQALLAEAQSLQVEANSKNHATTLSNLIEAMMALVANTTALESLRTINTIIASLGTIQNSALEISKVNSKAAENSQAIVGMRSFYIERPQQDTDLEWPNVQEPGRFGRGFGQDRLSVTGHNEDTVQTQSLFKNYTITWKSGRFSFLQQEGDFTLFGHYGADLSGITGYLQNGTIRLQALKNATDLAANQTGPNDPLPQYLLDEINLTKNLVSSFNAYINPIASALFGLAGTETTQFGQEYIQFSTSTLPIIDCQGNIGDFNQIQDVYDNCYATNSLQIVCPSSQLQSFANQNCDAELSAIEAYTLERREIAEAVTAAVLGQRFSGLLIDAVNNATDAVYNARLSKKPQIQSAFTAASIVSKVLENISYIPVKINEGQILAKINETDIDQVIADTVSGTIESNTATAVEVVIPDFDLHPEKALLCGTGDPIVYNLSLKVNVEWPIIPVQAGMWTPFSVPYIPKSNITLSNLARGCNIQSLAWWDFGAQQKAERSGASALTEPLQPGRGYYVLSSNTCTLRFISELFNDTGFIHFPVRNVSTARNFIGSSSRSELYDFLSVEEFKVFNAQSLPIEPFAGNCRPLGYEIHRNGLVRDKEQGNWTYVVEAQPTSTDPFSTAINISTAKVVDTTKPGKAYWIFNNYGSCSLVEKVTGDLQTTGVSGPAPITFSIAGQVPQDWQSGSFEGGILDTDLFDCGENCVSVGHSVIKFQSVQPAPGAALGEHEFKFRATSPRGGFDETIVKYLKISPKPEIEISKQGFNYAITIENTAPPACQARPFFSSVEQPPGWTVRGRVASTSVLPGQILSSQINLSPIPGAAQGGFLSIFVSSDVSDRTRQFEQDTIPCVPSVIAEDLASNDTHLFYTTEEGIRSFGIFTCQEAGDAAPNISFLAKPEGIALSGDRIIWLEGDRIRSMQNGAVSTIASGITADAFYVEADASSVYWIESNSVKRSTFGGTITTLATALDNPRGLALDDANVYWAERDKVRKVGKTATCSGSACQVAADIKDELLGTSEGRLWDVTVSGDFIYASVNSNLFSQSFDKILKIEKASGNASVLTKPYAEGPITSIASDSKNVYWLSGFGSGFPDKISQQVQTTEFTEPVIVPGHMPAIVSISPQVQQVEPGVILKYSLLVTNNNTPQAEPVSPFFVSDVNLPDGVLLCDGDDFFAKCEGMVRGGVPVTRSDLLNTYRTTWSRSIKRGNTSTLFFWARSSPGLPVGASRTFDVTVSSNDPTMSGTASASLVIRAPGPPRIEISPEVTCSPLPAGYIRPGCNGRFIVTVTNTEHTQAEFDVDVTIVNDTGHFNTALERSRLIVAGTDSLFELNFKDVQLNATGVGSPPFGRYSFIVNATNVNFPEKSLAATALLVVTPDDVDGICEAERGENEENTPDCFSADFSCPSGRCSVTNPYGVNFRALTKNGEATRFSACTMSPGVSDASSLQKCRENLASGQNVLCSNFTTSTLPSCGYTCAEKFGAARFIADIGGTLATSPKYSYICPSCSGLYASKLVQTDEFGSFFDPNFPGFGEITISQWLGYIKSEHLRADAYFQLSRPQWELCRDTVQSIVNAGTELKARADALSGRSDIYPIDGLCSSFRAEAADFINISDTVVAAACRVGILRANLAIEGLDIPEVAIDEGPKARVLITNRANETANAAARCTYTRPGFSYKSLSACGQLAPGESRIFEVGLGNATPGFWSAACEAGWSAFSDCRAVIGVGVEKKNFTVKPSPANLSIKLFEAPPYGVQGRRFQVRVDVENTGETANASVSCRLLDPAGGAHDAESDIKLVFTGRTLAFRPQLTLDQTGQWFVSECTVFKRSSIIPLQTIPINQPIIVFPECSGACQDRGFDYGGCFEGGGAIGTPGTLGCNSPEACVCGRLTLSNQACSRSSSTGGAGVFNASVRAEWTTGTGLRADGLSFSQSPASISRFFQGAGQKQMNITVLKGTQPIGISPLEFTCFAIPSIRLTSPPKGSTLTGLRTISADGVDAKNVEFLVDGTLIGNDSTFPYSITWNSAEFADGEHTISVQACNEFGCGFDEASVSLENGIAPIAQADYDFTIEPSAFSADIVANKRAAFAFTITNTGRNKDRITITETINTSWPITPSVNGIVPKRTADLDPGQSAVFMANISVPVSAFLGQAALLNIQGSSQSSGKKRTSGPNLLTVADKENTAPMLISAFHIPSRVPRSTRLTFFADIRDNDGDPVSAVVCRDKSCSQQWCTMQGQQRTQGGATIANLNCSITAPSPGGYSYYIEARAGKHSSLSSQKNFESYSPDRPSGFINILAGGTLSASSFVPTYPAGNAGDGDATTYWVSQEDLPQWLLVRLQDQRNIGGIGINSQSPNRPRVFDVFVGDCVTFERVYSEAAARYLDNWYRVGFDAIRGQCVRIDVSKTEDGSPYTSVAEFEIYEAGAPGRAPANLTGAPPGGLPPGTAPLLPIAAAVAVIAALLLIFRRRIALLFTYLRG